jgi:hypothetical protein
MNTHAHNGLTRDQAGIELDEVNQSRYSDSAVTEFKRTPSHASSFTGYSIFEDDEQSLIPHHLSMGSRRNLDEPFNDGSITLRLARKRRSRFSSWKIGVATAASTTTGVLLVNIILTIWASIKYGLDNGIGTAHEGSCDTVSAWSFWLHIIINALSSALLSASNYTMQCVTAPTRRECDFAHARGDWLDIGVPSVRNLFRISWRRRIMWTLLALTSTPIHLFYNSAVFKTLDNNMYDPFVVDRKFLDLDYTVPSAEILANASSGTYRGGSNGLFHAISMAHGNYTTNPGAYDNLTSESCIRAYTTYYLSGHGNVILVADELDTELVPTILDPNGELDAAGDFYLSKPLNPFNWSVRTLLSASRNEI